MKALVTALAIALTPLAAGAQDVALSPAQLRAVAVQVLREGDPMEAIRLSQLLLERDPTDDVALYVKAEALLAIGRPDLAARFGAAAFRSTEEDQLRYQAARLTAKAEAEAGDFTWSQLWLRRATPYVPSPEARAGLEQDYRALRAANPLQLSFGFGVAPSSNINNGSSSETVVPYGLGLFDLNADAQPLSGIEVSANGSLYYRLRRTERSQTSFEAGLSGRSYVLSDETRNALEELALEEYEDELEKYERVLQGLEEGDIPPPPPERPDETTGFDYSDATLTFGLEHVVAPESGPRRLSYGAEIGQVWYGGDPLRHFLRLSHDRTYDLGPDGSFLVSGLAEFQVEDGYDDSWTLTFRARHALPATEMGALVITSGFGAALTDDPDRGYQGLFLAADYDFAQPVFGNVELGLGASLDARVYEATRYSNQPGTTVDREDLRARTYLDVDLPGFEVYGFVPRVTLEAASTFSTVNFFDREEYSIGLDFRSAF
ncbi:hypothetical protein [Pseudoroseicyclus tamaricis]|uniref:Tetratricopeptide repeat protein n=1 Tax=Pseudoroseicyclus tamaricis TaxID=2705421 RepID=A0A6B2JIZ3_9RHOB|nr:hypothetical protein [Pseudoroseicyclus tamaricis]NDV01381.1 hypothetical protein [Pseudoroseicyclus tamaricis]